jgi:hypothetical protein
VVAHFKYHFVPPQINKKYTQWLRIYIRWQQFKKTKMAKVTLKGTGQLKGSVVINKTVELDDNQARNLTGSRKDDVITALLAVHYPGVKINPRQISVNIEYKK